jgi:murein DD-endopeptidase MepM/ murein hydrolase activator NlpD
MAATGVAAWDGSGPVTLAAGACMVAFLAIFPMWASGWFGLRGAFVAAFAVEVVVISIHTWGVAAGSGAPGIPTLCVFALFAIYLLLKCAAAARAPRGEMLDLRFPLKDGLYAVGQGGNGAPINHHASSRQQRFALDILKADGDISGAPVLSPCSGTIAAAADEMPDEGSLKLRGVQVFGNYVAVETESGALIMLAHLQSGSVCVQRGQRVRAGDIVGRAGNSGRSSEPHLHIHAERNGDAVPLRFDGRWLIRNSLVDA